MIDLKPCPFCGGAPELDTCRPYMSLEGSPMSGVAIYCVNNDPLCSADMMFCREDMPGSSTDDLVAALAEQWNRRPMMEKEDALNTLASVFHSGEEMEGDMGAVMVVDLALWNEGCEALEALIGGEEDDSQEKPDDP